MAVQRFRSGSLGLALPFLALAGTFVACQAVRTVAEAPGKVTESLLPGASAPARPPLSDLPGAVLQYADVFTSRIATASEEFAAAAGTPEAHLQAVEWRLEESRAAIQIATGPLPAASLLQLLATVTAARINHQEHWLPKVWGEADRPMLAAFEESERDGWALVELFLDGTQVAEVRRLIEEWTTRSRDSADGLIGRLSVADMTAALKAQQGPSRGKLLGFLHLDPLASLEPAAREVALTRLTVERSLFWAERLPLLVEDQLEQLVLRLRSQPEVVQVLQDVERTSLSLQDVSGTVARLPEELSAEREAAVRQISDELTAQRAGLVQDLETARGTLVELLEESRATFAAGATMSTEVAGAVRALDGFVGRFDEEEAPASAAPGGPAAPSEPPGKPFDITEYGAAAERLGTAAGELRALVNDLDANLPRLDRMVEVTAERGEQAIDHAFRRGLILGLTLIAAAAGATLLVRRFSRR